MSLMRTGMRRHRHHHRSSIRSRSCRRHKVRTNIFLIRRILIGCVADIHDGRDAMRMDDAMMSDDAAIPRDEKGDELVGSSAPSSPPATASTRAGARPFLIMLALTFYGDFVHRSALVRAHGVVFYRK